MLKNVFKHPKNFMKKISKNFGQKNIFWVKNFWTQKKTKIALNTLKRAQMRLESIFRTKNIFQFFDLQVTQNGLKMHPNRSKIHSISFLDNHFFI